MRFTLLITLLTIFSLVSAGDYQLIRVDIRSEADLERLARLGIDFEGARYKENNFIDLPLSTIEKDKIINAGFSIDILEADLEEYYAFRLETRPGEGFGFGSMGGYYTFSEVLANLDSMIALYPALITDKDTIGYSILGKPIIGVKISDNPYQPENEPEVLYTGLHHAREPVSMMNILYYMWYLLENYGSDPQATYLVNNRQMWFIPVVNPDGYVHNEQTNPGGGGMWRLNARDNNDNGVYFQSGIDGVDLNRNYGYQWGFNNIGSSPTAGSSTYRGPSPFSEVETMAIRNFCNLHQFRTAFNYHTYSNLLIHPWAYNDSPTPDHRYFHTFGLELTRFNGYTLGTPSQTVGYSVNGDANDWMYGEQTSKPKIISYTPEIGSSSDGFWPATSRILPLVEENLYPNIILSYIAGAYPKMYHQEIFVYGQNNQPDPGEFIEIYPYLTNFGLQNSAGSAVELLSRSPLVSVLNSQISFSSMQAFDTLLAPTPWQFQIDYNTPIGTELVFDVHTYDNGELITVDSMKMTVGTFDLSFSDSAEAGLTQWTTGGTGGSWTTTTASFHSETHSFTESAGGNYANYANVWMQSASIDLGTATTAELTFWTRWDIEADWDFGLVEISTNGGSSWTHLVGQYMTAASGIGVQTSGLHGYEGQQANWVKERINLNAYCGQNILIRFRLITDSGVTEDGWYLDDIAVRSLSNQTNIPPFISSVTNLGYQVYSGASYPVDAVALDDESINQVSLFYSTDNGGTFQEIPMSGVDSLYHANIPALSPGTSVVYYVTAWDNNGLYAHFPFNAPYQMLRLNVTGAGPLLIVEPASFSLNVSQLSSRTETLKIINPDTMEINFSITDSTIQNSSLNSQENNRSLNVQYIIKAIRRNLLLTLHQHPEFFQNYDPISLFSGSSGNPIETIIIADSSGDAGTAGMDIHSIDFSENLLNYIISITYGGPPDTNSISVVSFDVDQNFGTGAYPAPVGYGLGNHDTGSEYDVLFDYANFIGDSLGISPSVYVLDVSTGGFVPVGLPIPFQVNGNTVTANLPKFLFNIFDPMMNISATALPLFIFSEPDFAPDFGHGNLGGELGSSWVTQLDNTGNSFYPFTGTLAAGDSILIDLKVAAAYPLGNYQAMLKIAGNGPVSPIEVPVNMTITLPGIPQIGVSPAQIRDTLQVGPGSHTRALSLENSGSARLYYIISDTLLNGSEWLTYDPAVGLIEAGAQENLTIQIDKTNLTVNTRYQAELRISSTDPVQPEVTVPVDIYISSTSGIQQAGNTIKELTLHANYPNPFNPTTTISFDLPSSMAVTLDIYNLLGQRVKRITSGYMTAGTYQFTWDGTNEQGQAISAGIYFYRLETPEGILLRKMILAK